MARGYAGVETRLAPLGDLQGLGEIRRGTSQVPAQAAQGGLGQSRGRDGRGPREPVLGEEDLAGGVSSQLDRGRSLRAPGSGSPAARRGGRPARR